MSFGSDRSISVRVSIEGQPVAVTATDEDLYVALDDNTVQQSSDDGATWTTRAASMP